MHYIKIIENIRISQIVYFDPNIFYDKSLGPDSQFFLMEIFLRRLGVRDLYRIKANLNPRTFFHRKTGYHVDLEESGPHQTAVYYVNSNNGYTEFKKGGKVKSVANRMVIFDSKLEHQGVTTTDQKARVVINFNYV